MSFSLSELREQGWAGRAAREALGTLSIAPQIQKVSSPGKLSFADICQGNESLLEQFWKRWKERSQLQSLTMVVRKGFKGSRERDVLGT